MKILIVDDHQLFLDGLVYVLSSYKSLLEIVIATNTAEALRKFSAQDFDLVLLDLNMPGLDGISCLGSLRKIQPAIPIVIISAMEDSELVIGALKLGAVGFIPKSFTQEQMFDALDKLVADSLTVQEISDRLQVSPNTIKSHIKKLYQCLNVSSRLEVVTEARRLGLLG